jgi:hypothetical protein
MIAALHVKRCGLIPQLLGNALPTQGAIAALRVQSVKQRHAVEVDLHTSC